MVVLHNMEKVSSKVKSIQVQQLNMAELNYLEDLVGVSSSQHICINSIRQLFQKLYFKFLIYYHQNDLQSIMEEYAHF